MRVKQPAALDVRSILQAAFDARDTDPELFGLWLTQRYDDTEWHDRPKDGEPWRHHASSISECLRRSVLNRAGAEKEPADVSSLVTFEVGHHIHLLLQFGLAVHPEYRLLAHEVGGDISLMEGSSALVALADAVYEHDGERYLLEIKSEASFAGKMRREEAKREERKTTARPDHMVQVRAQAMVLRKLRPDLAPDGAFIIYWEKNSGECDQQPVDIDPELDVLGVIAEREVAWMEYRDFAKLPKRLASFPKGLCAPRSETDARGKYCPFRGECSRLPA